MSEFLPTGVQLTYLVAASLFIVGLKKLGSPASARNGNSLAAVGMLLAVVATLLDRQVLNYQMILLGLVIGSLIGAIAAYKVQMTEMPQMVGLLNGLGGAASALVAVAEFWRLLGSQTVPLDVNISMLLDVFIGGITFTGSMLAFAKLQGLISGSPITFPLQQPINALLLIGYIAGSAYLLITPGNLPVFLALIAVSLILGVMFVIPIGGGDMPVVISLLNSLSGVAASAAGFVVMNNMLIIAGALVGAYRRRRHDRLQPHEPHPRNRPGQRTGRGRTGRRGRARGLRCRARSRPCPGAPPPGGGPPPIRCLRARQSKSRRFRFFAALLEPKFL